MVSRSISLHDIRALSAMDRFLYEEHEFSAPSIKTMKQHLIDKGLTGITLPEQLDNKILKGLEPFIYHSHEFIKTPNQDLFVVKILNDNLKVSTVKEKLTVSQALDTISLIKSPQFYGAFFSLPSGHVVNITHPLIVSQLINFDLMNTKGKLYLYYMSEKYAIESSNEQPKLFWDNLLKVTDTLTKSQYEPSGVLTWETIQQIVHDYDCVTRIGVSKPYNKNYTDELVTVVGSNKVNDVDGYRKVDKEKLFDQFFGSHSPEIVAKSVLDIYHEPSIHNIRKALQNKIDVLTQGDSNTALIYPIHLLNGPIVMPYYGVEMFSVTKDGRIYSTNGITPFVTGNIKGLQDENKETHNTLWYKEDDICTGGKAKNTLSGKLVMNHYNSSSQYFTPNWDSELHYTFAREAIRQSIEKYKQYKERKDESNIT